MRIIPAIVCLALASLDASAAGLGDLTVKSALGEPFTAEIGLSASTQEMDSMSARIASRETYAAQGLDRPSALDGVKVEIYRHAGSMAVLKLSSPNPIEDPFLQMLVQIEWSSGRLLREYNALLDPPGFGEQVAQISLPVAAPAAAQPKTATPSPAARSVAVTLSDPAPAAIPPGAAASPEQAAVADDDAGTSVADRGEGYRIKRGDTLRSIAQRHRMQGISIERMLVGLFRGNTEAFMGDNMNRLMEGQLLFNPTEQELDAISQKEALREIRQHTAQWRASRSRKPASSMAASSRAGKQTVAGKAGAKTGASQAEKAAEPRFVLKVSPGDTSWATKPRAQNQPASAKSENGGD